MCYRQRGGPVPQWTACTLCAVLSLAANAGIHSKVAATETSGACTVNASGVLTSCADVPANVTTLRLAHRGITSIAPGVFDTLGHLNGTLDLESNPLTHLPAQSLARLSKLQSLILLFCHLTVIEPGTFTHLVSLSNLDLDDNQITVLPETALPSSLDQVNAIDVYDNPVYYGCEPGYCRRNVSFGYVRPRRPTVPTCNVAPPGGYCDASTRHPLPCAAGRYANVSASATDQCSGPCAAGRWGGSGERSDQCSGACRAGRFCPVGTNETGGVKCLPGTYSGSVGATNASTCRPCPAGAFCNSASRDGGAEAPTPCPADSFSSARGAAACQRCTAGTGTNGRTGSTSYADCTVSGSSNSNVRPTVLVIVGIAFGLTWALLWYLSQRHTRRVHETEGKRDEFGQLRIRDYTQLLVSLLALYHFGADVYFLQVHTLGAGEHTATRADGLLIAVFGAATALSFACNIVYCVVTVRREIRQNPTFRHWLHANTSAASVVMVMGASKVGSLRLLRCGAFGMSPFNAPVRRNTILRVTVASNALATLEDVPQLICAVTIAAQHGTLLVLSNTATIASGSVSLLVQVMTGLLALFLHSTRDRADDADYPRAGMLGDSAAFSGGGGGGDVDNVSGNGSAERLLSKASTPPAQEHSGSGVGASDGDGGGAGASARSHGGRYGSLAEEGGARDRSGASSTV